MLASGCRQGVQVELKKRDSKLAERDLIESTTVLDSGELVLKLDLDFLRKVEQVSIDTSSECNSPVMTQQVDGKSLAASKDASIRFTPPTTEGDYYVCTWIKDAQQRKLTKPSPISWVKPLGDFTIGSPTSTVSPTFSAQWAASQNAMQYRVVISSSASCAATQLERTTTDVQLTFTVTQADASTQQRYLCVCAIRQTLSKAAFNQGLSLNTQSALALGQPSFTDNDNRNLSLSNYLGSVHMSYGKVFLVDKDQNRVLIWNNGISSPSTKPDLVLGQRGVNQGGQAGTTATSLYVPESVFFDGTRLFVADAYSNRVLIWNQLPTVSGQAPNVVLGQPDFSTGTANNPAISGQSLNYPTGVFSDGTKLVVADRNNNRVLIWNTIPTVNHTTADVVVGQSNMTTAAAKAGGSLNAMSLYEPQSAKIFDAKLFVADKSNSRVLIWNSVPTANAQNADVAVGQANLTSTSAGVALNRLWIPLDMEVSSGKLFVLDWANNRGLIYNTVPTSHNANADVVMGQPNGVTNSVNPVSASTVLGAVSISVSGNKIAIAEEYSNRLMIWNAIPTTNNEPSSFVWGQPSSTTDYVNNVPSTTTLSNPYALASEGVKLAVSDTANNRVLIWNSIPITIGQPADLVLGQPDFTSQKANRGGAVAANTLSNPVGISIKDNKLYVSEAANNRVLIWSSFPTSNGQNADYVLGQPDMISSTANNGGRSTNSLSYPYGITVTPTKIYVADLSNQRILGWDKSQIGASSTANIVLGQPDFTSGTVNNGGISNRSLAVPLGIRSTGEDLLVADRNNHRILVWRGQPQSNFESADEVIGQSNFISNMCQSSQNGFCGPIWAVQKQNEIFVADQWNNRVMKWQVGGATAQAVYGQADYTSQNQNRSSATLQETGYGMPTGLAVFAGGRIGIADVNNDRIIILRP